MSDPLIFVIGSQKSGTTWLRDCLSHRFQFPRWQEWYFPELVDSIQQHVHSYGQRMTKQELNERCRSTVRASWVSLLQEANADKSAYPCVDLYHQLRPGLYAQAVRLVRTYFPEAKVAVIVRDPRAVLNSLVHFLSSFRARWGKKINVAQFAATWAEQNRQWEQDQPDIFLRYEDLKSNFKHTVRATYQALGVELDDGEINQIHAAEFDVSKKRHVQPNLYRSGIIDEWRTRLSYRQMAIVEEVAGELMSTCGYGGSTAGTAGGNKPRQIWNRLVRTQSRLFGSLGRRTTAPSCRSKVPSSPVSCGVHHGQASTSLL